MEEKEKKEEEVVQQEDQKREEKPEEKELQELRQKVKELEEKVKKLEQIARNSNMRAMELQKELEYMRERYRRDLEEQRKFGYEKFALEILSVIDNFERALESAKLSKDFDALLKGVEMIYSELLKILDKFNICEIDIQGKEFDPYLAEAVERVCSEDHPPNVVVKVLQKGYKLHDKVIRPARVAVSVKEEEGGDKV